MGVFTASLALHGEIRNAALSVSRKSLKRMPTISPLRLCHRFITQQLQRIRHSFCVIYRDVFCASIKRVIKQMILLQGRGKDTPGDLKVNQE